jgi:hypothetical protein
MVDAESILNSIPSKQKQCNRNLVIIIENTGSNPVLTINKGRRIENMVGLPIIEI